MVPYRFGVDKAMDVFELLILMLFAYAASPSTAIQPCFGRQKICDRGAKGSIVVNAAIAHIEKDDLFNNSDTNRFLRRVAHVGTRDGTIYRNESEMFAHGGIWNFDEGKLNQIRRALFFGSIGMKLAEVNNRIKNRYDFNIFADYYTHQYVTKPLFCGVAIRFYLYYLELVECVCCIPSALDVRGQANMWLTYFNVTVGSRPCLEDHFVNEVEQLDKKEGWSINADIIFVLDLSYSINQEEFRKMKNFQLGFVKEMTIGKNDTQVGTIIFKDNAIIIFNLSDHNNTKDLIKTIEHTYHDGIGFTNIQDALCLLNSSFDEEKGGRRPDMAVFRIAIIMTDGKSNQDHNGCNWSNSGEAARKVHESLKPLELYVIGVGNETNETELQAIASPGCYAHIDSFNHLEDIQRQLFHRMSHRDSASVRSNPVIHAIMGYNQEYRYNLQIEYSMMVNICVSAGSHIKLYASTYISDPSAAFCEYELDIDNEKYDADNMTEVCRSEIIHLNDLRSGEKKHKRSTSDRKTIYFSVVGKATANTFRATMNDTYIEDDTERLTLEDYSDRVEEDNKMIIVASTSSTVLLVISTGVLSAVVCGCVFHLRKKKKIEGEDDYKLLPQTAE